MDLMDLRLRIALRDGAVLDVSEDEARELFERLRALFDKAPPVWVNPLPLWNPHPLMPWEAPVWSRAPLTGDVPIPGITITSRSGDGGAQ
jgi:hypothetical protein